MDASSPAGAGLFLCLIERNSIEHSVSQKDAWPFKELAESGAGDQTIMDIAGHVSRQMLARYSHIRMEAKRAALEGIVSKPEQAPKGQQPSTEWKAADK